MIENTTWLALCIYFEARGESEPGQVAVGHVILNRASARQMSVQQIVQQPYQFSWYNDNQRPHIDDYDALVAAFESAHECLVERLEGETLDGCDHYHASWMTQYPAWADRMTMVSKIGRHIFYRS